MKSSTTLAPTIVPVLSKGHHRTPRQGACFMEFASFLAGEKWSDHPACTDGALAHLARGVNDLVGDDARATLTTLIPSVIGLTADNNRIPLIVAARAGAAALPIASETRQRTIAVGLQHLLSIMEATDAGLARTLGPDIRASLSLAPAATAWARRFRAAAIVQGTGDVPAIARNLTSVAVVGIAEACVDDSDTRLTSLLRIAIDDSVRFTRAPRVPAAEVATFADS